MKAMAKHRTYSTEFKRQVAFVRLQKPGSKVLASQPLVVTVRFGRTKPK
jgi:hypothetical protein